MITRYSKMFISFIRITVFNCLLILLQILQKAINIHCPQLAD